MGLNSKDAVLKKEALEGCIEPAAVPVPVPMMMNNQPNFFWPGSPDYLQFLKGIPSTSQLVIPCRYGSMGDSVPAQLTIFYDGMVNVYDGVSPAKAQAIMFLAGNWHFVAMAEERIQAQGPTPMTPNSTQPCSPVSSPMSVTSHHVDQLTGGLPNETEAAKRIISSLGQAMQSAIPQARRASLARFLEKRRERVMSSAPYCLSKNTLDCASNTNAAVIAGK